MEKMVCSECGEEFDKDEMVSYEGSMVCEYCKYDLENPEGEDDE